MLPSNELGLARRFFLRPYMSAACLWSENSTPSVDATLEEWSLSGSQPADYLDRCNPAISASRSDHAASPWPKKSNPHKPVQCPERSQPSAMPVLPKHNPDTTPKPVEKRSACANPAEQARIENLLQRVIESRDPQAWTALDDFVRRYAHPICVSYRLSDIENAQQEVCVHLYFQAIEDKIAASFPLLTRVIRNKVLDICRQQGRAPASRSLLGEAGKLSIDPISQASSPPEQLIAKERLSAALAFIESLPPRQQAYFRLNVFDQLAYDEIGDLHGRKSGTVGNMVRRTRDRLCDHFGEHRED